MNMYDISKYLFAHSCRKVVENHFGPGKPWKLKLKVLKSRALFLVVQMENKQQ